MRTLFEIREIRKNALGNLELRLCQASEEGFGCGSRLLRNLLGQIDLEIANRGLWPEVKVGMFFRVDFTEVNAKNEPPAWL
jgi:hypothetical protein